MALKLRTIAMYLDSTKMVCQVGTCFTRKLPITQPRERKKKRFRFYFIIISAYVNADVDESLAHIDSYSLETLWASWAIHSCCDGLCRKLLQQRALSVICAAR